MRIRTTLVGLLALFPLTASASPYDRPHGGFFLRLHQATLVSDDIPDRFIEPYTGFGAGVFAAIPTGNVLALQAEAAFSRRGGRVVVKEAGFEGEDTYRFDYLELATLLRLGLPLGPATQLYLEGGLALALLLDAELDGYYTDGYLYDSYSEDVTEYLESPEPCALLGAGISFPMGSTGLLLGVRYQWGLIDPVKQFPVEVRSRNLAIQLGMAF